ncbi:MAG: nucleoside triphosphate pyrophosphohydrolase [Candidatus Tectomicrobia bacterium]|uniref:Nucleoside triphosphate pyrophosphohydrolase n=1 Tax=Tectimicrobiota bacterium TaxID=2528274 RepID=A0A933GPT2_UNCTE|nr:nucleoside triphosphate pyrophosphohydrolase [Candidatus Tectomicrobia bacterium]
MIENTLLDILRELAPFQRVVFIMETLRGENGCPWDKEQTRESLKSYLIEEAYEVMEALEDQDPEELKKELGDLLFQILFHAQIAKEKGEFDIWEVLSAISEKMIRRHPHVFGDDKAETAAQVLVNWERIKKKEGKGNGMERKSVLDGVPTALPALLRAYRLQDKASRVGFDWQNIAEVMAKVDEEMKEFKEAYSENDREKIEMELGDLLFSLVNVSRFLHVNPEGALGQTIKRFMKRFQYIEQTFEKQGKSMEKSTLEEMDVLWNEAKKQDSSL